MDKCLILRLEQEIDKMCLKHLVVPGVRNDRKRRRQGREVVKEEEGEGMKGWKERKEKGRGKGSGEEKRGGEGRKGPMLVLVHQGSRETTEKTPNGQSWNNLSNKIK